jgi:hypothetical protein
MWLVSVFDRNPQPGTILANESSPNWHRVLVRRFRRWVTHVDTNAEDLEELARRSRTVSDPDRTRGVAASTYGHIAANTPLWVEGSSFELADGPILIEVDGRRSHG